jgi:hypothetical protein
MIRLRVAGTLLLVAVMATASLYVLIDRRSVAPQASPSLGANPPRGFTPAASAFNPRAPGSRKYRSFPPHLPAPRMTPARESLRDDLASGAPAPRTHDHELGDLPSTGGPAGPNPRSNGLGATALIVQGSK